MKPVFHCQSCGFTSTVGTAFVRFNRVLVCLNCKEEYGEDPNVTRWIDEAVENMNNSVKSAEHLEHTEGIEQVEPLKHLYAFYSGLKAAHDFIEQMNQSKSPLYADDVLQPQKGQYFRKVGEPGSYALEHRCMCCAPMDEEGNYIYKSIFENAVHKPNCPYRECF